MQLYIISSVLSVLTLAVNAAILPRSGQKSPISAEQFRIFKHFTEFVSASAFQPCDTPPHGVQAVSYISKKETTTQATIFRDDYRKHFILAMPGSNQREDYKLDAEVKMVPYKSPGVSCGDCYVHKGFLTAWNSVADEVRHELTQNMGMYPDYKLYIAGHSLGASIAQLAYATLIGEKFPVEAAYTMGQPRVGNLAFANFIDNLSGASMKKAGHYHRITHAMDWVPQWPSESLGYVHPGTEYWESEVEHNDGKTTFRCRGNDPDDCNKSDQDVKKANRLDVHMTYSNILIDDPSVCGE